MSEFSYRPLIEDMTWSYSRVTTFTDCPYRFFLKYIKGIPEDDMFYASYGSFMHKLLEGFYKNELSKEQMLAEFLLNFSTEVKGARPSSSIVDKYINAGIEYIKNFERFPFKTIGVEKKVEFKIGDNNFVGFIDYLGEKDGEYYIVDNKSRDLKPRSKRTKPTLKDAELDEMLKQLYIYSAAVKQEYGKFPKELCFNCFKTNTFIREPFNEEVYKQTIDWISESIEEIKDCDDFHPVIEFFPCRYICGVNGNCCYYGNG